MTLGRSPKSLGELSKRLQAQSKAKRRDELARLRATSGINKGASSAFDRVRVNLYLQESWASWEIKHPLADLDDDQDEEQEEQQTAVAIAAQ